MSVSVDKLKEVACNAIDAAAEDLNSLSQEIWKHAELCFEEKQSHDALCDFLDKYGFPVERKIGPDTAFKATVGTKKVKRKKLCETQDIFSFLPT